MARPKDFGSMYLNMMELNVIDDLEKNPEMIKQLEKHRKKFIKWCAKQRVSFEADIFDEVDEFVKKFINSRLYNIDVKLWKKISSDIFQRDSFTCIYCGQTGGILEVDHVIPISLGGTNEEKNLVTSCRKCNRQKRNKTKEQFLAWREKQ